MNNKTDYLSVTEANQNFSKAEMMAKENGAVYIFKRKKPKYLLVDLDVNPAIEMTDDEKIDFVARRILNKYKSAFKQLAK